MGFQDFKAQIKQSRRKLRGVMKKREFKTGIICSEFHWELVQPLYSEAIKELAPYAAPVGGAGETSAEGAAWLRKAFSQDNRENLLNRRAVKFMDLSKPGTFSDFKKDGLADAPVAIKPLIRLVPGTGEIPLMARWMIERQKVEGILALGAVIRGETAHYGFLCSFLERALWDLQREYALPVVFSVLMLESRAQAAARLKRGREGARALINMLRLSKSL